MAQHVGRQPAGVHPAFHGGFHHPLHEHGIELPSVGPHKKVFRRLPAHGLPAHPAIMADGLGKFAAERDESILITFSMHF